jgi:hypothetical protein
VFFSIINNSGLNKYYAYYLGGVIVFINNKFIIDRDIPSGEIRVPSIAKSVLFLNIKEISRKFFFLKK